MKPLIIAIDGYVATGKGTTAVWLARKLHYAYLDTGAMYRAVAWYAIQHGLLDSTETQKEQMMRDIEISFHYNPLTQQSDTYLNGENIESSIRTTELGLRMKPIVTSPVVRFALGKMQQELWNRWGIVVDGRDMGTVVFPHADVKVFLVGDIHVRAQRRFKQLQEKWQQVTLEEVYQDIETRDQTDYLWPYAVNHKAPDAIEIDTSILTIDEQIDKIYQLALSKIHV